MRSMHDVLENDKGLDLYGWTLTYAYDITPDGSDIVGEGINPAGQIEAWMAFLGD